MGDDMKFTVLCLILILEAVFAFQAYAFQDGNQSVGIDLETIDAVEAIAIANAWKWSRTDVTTSVTAREVVFKFSDGTQKKIPLPEDKMMVAVAPYIRQTHK
jgi:hypothetical protein